MAAPIGKVMPTVLQFRKTCLSFLQTSHRNMGFIGNLRRRVMGEPDTEKTTVIRIEEAEEDLEEDTRIKRKCIEEVRPYSPPLGHDVEEKIQKSVDLIIGPTENWREIQLNSRLKKYELLTTLIEEFDHDIPNRQLNEMSTVEDVINYYKTEVRDTSIYTDMATLDLPKNLHINLEPIRFDKNTDTIYGGKSAFPELKTVVTSVKYRRKYKGTDDDTDPVMEKPLGIARWKK